MSLVEKPKGLSIMQDAQQQLLAVQSQAAQVAKAKARMEVETLRISQRIEILNNISTQGALLAGSSISFLGGESLETIDDHETMFHLFFRVAFVCFGALALCASLWVIVVSSHLIALTRDASLRKNIVRASNLLDKGMKEVRGVHQCALAFVLFACGTGAVLNMERVLSILVFLIFTAFFVQVVHKQQLLSVLFYEHVNLEPEVAATGSLGELSVGWLEPMLPSSRERMRAMWRSREPYSPYHRHLEEDGMHEFETAASLSSASSSSGSTLPSPAPAAPRDPPVSYKPKPDSQRHVAFPVKV